MQDSTVTVPSLVVVTISMMGLTYRMKPRWIGAIGVVGSGLDLFGMIRFYYFHQASAKHLLSVPGIALIGISVMLTIHRTITQWKRERV